MKTNTLGWLVGLGAIASSFLSCSQAKIDCQVSLAGSSVPYIAQYIVKGSPPACAMTAGIIQDGDLIGMEYYHPPTADGTTYDSTKSTLAIQANNFGNIVGTYESVGDGDPCESHLACTG